jgi:putative Holliday junction resolvase
VERNKIGEIIIGYPLNMDGSTGRKVQEVDEFIRRLAAKLQNDVKITRVDERLTSEQATNEAKAFHGKQSAVKKQKHRRRGIVDAMAAVIILQDFLDGMKFGSNH